MAGNAATGRWTRTALQDYSKAGRGSWGSRVRADNWVVKVAKAAKVKRSCQVTIPLLESYSTR